MKALVTGASGFIGYALCETLLREGESVRAVVRQEALYPPYVHDRQVVPGLDARTDWPRLLDGIDTVFHVAGAAHVKARDAAHLRVAREINVDATEALARAASGVRRVVYVSTAKVHGEWTRERPFRESDPPAPTDEYARLKLEAEEVLRASIRPAALTIIRPPLVYGPRVRANFLSLLRLVDLRVPLPFASVQNARSLVFVRNLVTAMIWTAANDISGTFLVSDGEDVSTAELVRRIAGALRRKPALIGVPPAILRTLARITAKRSAFEKVAASFQVDTTAIRTAGWRPQYSMHDGLEETAAWYRSARVR